jgi:hypothetical protein
LAELLGELAELLAELAELLGELAELLVGEHLFQVHAKSPTHRKPK